MSTYADSNRKISILGGDLRYIYLALMLSDIGYDITVYGTDLTYDTLNPSIKDHFLSTIKIADSMQEALSASEIILGPIPFSKDLSHITSKEMREDLTVSNLYQLISPSQLLIAGSIPKIVCTQLDQLQVSYHDLMKLDSIAILNAIATAEGSIAEAILRSPINLHGCHSLVLGYGRCASVLAQKLSALGGIVTVAARKDSAIAAAYAAGLSSLPLSEALTNLGHYEFIFNTIPSVVLTNEVLKGANPGVTIIDIASSPGGVDYQAAKTYNLNASLCLALPGKYAPKTSAEILAQQISRILSD